MQALASVPALAHVAREIESLSDRWNHWVHHPTPEAVDPPGPAARASPLEKLLLVPPYAQRVHGLGWGGGRCKAT